MSTEAVDAFVRPASTPPIDSTSPSADPKQQQDSLPEPNDVPQEVLAPAHSTPPSRMEKELPPQPPSPSPTPPESSSKDGQEPITPALNDIVIPEPRSPPPQIISTTVSPRQSISSPITVNGRNHAISPSIASIAQSSASRLHPTPGRRSSTFSAQLSIPRSGSSQPLGVSATLILPALNAIVSSKEAKRSPPLREAAQRALDMVHAGEGGDRPREIFEPLRLACETHNETLMVASLDCIAKLISYSFFAESLPPSQSYHSPPASPSASSTSVNHSAPASLADLVTHTITSTYTEHTPDAVALQIVKALLALILSPTILVHHSSLLKAVRTVYNVFLLSTDPSNQMVAQGGLTQMVNHVFARCKVTDPASRNVDSDSESHSRDSLSIHHTPSTSTPNPITPPPLAPTPELSTSASLQTSPETPSLSLAKESPDAEAETEVKADTEQERPAEDLPDQPAADVDGKMEAAEGHLEDDKPPVSTTLAKSEARVSVDEVHESESVAPSSRHITTNDLFVKDAFLVFRALCKLSMKPLNTESERDLKSHAMRSKLLSLHLILTILDTHLPIFLDPYAVIYSATSREAPPFMSTIKQYLCLSLSRNAISTVPQVFDISVEIFWRVLAGMRSKLKKEIEVLLNEIFIPILEMRNSTVKQKLTLFSVLHRLCQDPQALVDIYLNYDCDRNSLENIYERLINIISKIGTTHVNPLQKGVSEPSTSQQNTHKSTRSTNGLAVPPSLTTTALGGPQVAGNTSVAAQGTAEFKLKRQSLECLVAVLRSLVAWGTGPGKGLADSSNGSLAGLDHPSHRQSEDVRLENGAPGDAPFDRLSETARISTPDVQDDPNKFESEKQRKTKLIEGIKRFNFKPKRGLQFLFEAGFIPSKAPQDIAKFLLTTEGLSKAIIGEYLGEGDEDNVACMHAFVDMLDFTDLAFVDALRMFLQSFRLPGEAQKIDRFMLKFAEKFIGDNTSTIFANADTAYVLAYSTIMLNTDAFNPQVKNRMSKLEFIKNNRGINDGQDLPEEFLSDIYDNIYSNEIRMKDEIETHVATPAPGLITVFGRDMQKEAYLLQSVGMANKTEALFKTMMRAQRKGLSKSNDQFFSASHFIHVRPMFEVAWMPFLTGLSGPLQDTDDLEVVDLCLEGFKHAIRLVCFFDLELERNAFVTTLTKFTFLNNLGEMKTKNMEAIKALLDIAVSEGNNLRGSWHEVLTCVSQLEQMQLISSGADVPEARRGSKSSGRRKLPAEELANESRSTHITVAADMVFSLSHYLSGTAIVDFVQALSDVSWEEIQSSGLSDHPRLFSLQKLVDISYYNMTRIRLEWSNMWAILGEHFNKVCCHSNPHVAFFALDALRQLAMRFLAKPELSHYKFQKDFLRPFEYAMIHNSNPDVRDLVLQCLDHMIQRQVADMRSGWRTLFGVLSAASKVLTERIASSAFELVTRLNRDHFPAIVRYGSFADLTVCITDFCKVSKYQKISLLAIAMLRGIIPTMHTTPEINLNSPPSWSHQDGAAAGDDPMIKYWFPILFSFYDIIMNGEDLEVRRLALDSLFSTLKTYGSTFRVDFWDTVCRELLFPIFAVLRSSQDLSRFTTQEDMSVWLSTTMIQALRNLIDLYTYYFDTLDRTFDGLLDLLCVCICQENDTLARIGTSCFQQLLEKNVKKLGVARWERVVTAFVRLFKTTTPHQLFDESLRLEGDGSTIENESSDAQSSALIPAPLSPSHSASTPQAIIGDRRRIFKQIIVKCVLQLLLIETTHDLLRNDEVYRTIPPEQLLRLMGELDHSYQFARDFNGDKDLRTGLWKVGFMKHLPNLLKQESSSAATLINILLRMYRDKRSDHQAAKEQVLNKLVPLGLGVIQDFNALRADTQAKNIIAWTPVVAEVLHGFCTFDDHAFARYLPAIYPLLTEILSRDMASEVREAVRSVFVRVGEAKGLMDRI